MNQGSEPILVRVLDHCLTTTSLDRSNMSRNDAIIKRREGYFLLADTVLRVELQPK